MTVYYLVPIPPGAQTVSGGTRKLFDHVAILNAHGIAAEALSFLPPQKIESGPENLFVVPEVYGEYLIEALPPGVPRVAMIQNGYLLDYRELAAPGSPHPLLRCPDLVAVMVESAHTEEIVRARFPDLPCPIIRFTSSGNGRDGHGAGLYYGPWPRSRTITYFKYKYEEVYRFLFADLELPPGWSLRPLAKLTDGQVAEALRTAAIFCAPLSLEGLCGTTQEAIIAGPVIVSWPGGPSRYVPKGWSEASMPQMTIPAGNTTSGGPMEYLAGHAQIAPQDDIAALRRLLVETAWSIEADPGLWARRTEEWSRWHTEEAYSRKHEVAEIVEIMGRLLADHTRPGAHRPARAVEALDRREAAERLAGLGRDAEAAEILLDELANGADLGRHLALLVSCLDRCGRPLADVAAALSSERRAELVGRLAHTDTNPALADRLLEAFHEADPAALVVLAAATRVAPRLEVARRLVWSARLRALGLGASCPTVASLADQATPVAQRALAAAAALASFADARAHQAFVALVLSLDEGTRAALRPALGGVAPGLAGLLDDLPLPPAGGSDAPAAASALGWPVAVVSRQAASPRARGLAALFAAHGHDVVLLEPATGEVGREHLAAAGVRVECFSERTDWRRDVLGLLLRHREELGHGCVVVPGAQAEGLAGMLRAALPGARLVVDADTGPTPSVAADLVLTSDGRPGTRHAPASAADYLPERPPLPLGLRSGICIAGNTRGEPLPATRALEAIGDALAAAAGEHPVAVLGDDPEARLVRHGWLAVGALDDPTPWLAGARALVTLEREGAHWRALAARVGTPVLVVPDDLGEAAAVVAALAGLLAGAPASLPAPAVAVAAEDPLAPLGAPPVGTPGPSTLRVLADGAEALADERILSTYAEAFSPADDTSLVLYGPGLEPAAFEEDLRAVARRCGLDLEHGPAVAAVLPPERRREDEATLAGAVTAVLSARAGTGALGGLPLVCPGDPAALRALAGARHGAGVGRSPLVSVLVPVYNHARYLRGCVESVLAQTLGDVEILLVDDRSPDGSVEVAEALCRLDRRVRLVRNETNLGLVGNHRRCLELASGEFVKFLHADDRLHPDALERLVAAALAHPEAALVTSVRDVIDESGAPVAPVAWTVPLTVHDAVVDATVVGDFLLSTGLNRVGEPSTVLFRRDAITPGEFSTFAGRTYTSLLDISTWLTLLRRGSLVYLPDALSSLRLHDGQYGVSLGPVVQHHEWLDLLAAAHEAGFLAGPGQFADALATMSMRLVAAYAARPDGTPEAVGAAITRAMAALGGPRDRLLRAA